MRNSIVDNLSKKQKFIILLVGGGIIIVGAFIWSMVLNLSQMSILNPVPELSFPKEISEIIEKNNSSSELQNITEILEKDKNKSVDLDENNKANTELNLDSDTKQ